MNSNRTPHSRTVLADAPPHSTNQIRVIRVIRGQQFLRFPGKQQTVRGAQFY